MGLDVHLRIRRPATGECRDLESYRGSDFKFVMEYIDDHDMYGKYMLVDEEVRAFLTDGGLKRMREKGFLGHEMVDDYGIIGFVRNLYLMEFYARMGYVLEVEADW